VGQDGAPCADERKKTRKHGGAMEYTIAHASATRLELGAGKDSPAVNTRGGVQSKIRKSRAAARHDGSEQ
jgi:hypothetical protein